LHLNIEHLEEIGCIPSRSETLGLQAAFGRMLLFEETEAEMPENRQVFGGMVLAYATVILKESDI
jgi:hypothetical protein